MAVTVLGEFHDIGTVNGEADVGDAMEYAVRVANPGSVTVTDVGECSLYPTPRKGLDCILFAIAFAAVTIVRLALTPCVVSGTIMVIQPWTDSQIYRGTDENHRMINRG